MFLARILGRGAGMRQFTWKIVQLSVVLAVLKHSVRVDAKPLRSRHCGVMCGPAHQRHPYCDF
jgi:hypothetical protein